MPRLCVLGVRCVRYRSFACGVLIGTSHFGRLRHP
ncbi:hypothetical protein M2169_005852 [Streptomyces sp. MJP52]|nr:hypothetical protein [Streptomyces sp. MJP52]